MDAICDFGKLQSDMAQAGRDLRAESLAHVPKMF